MHSAGLRPDGQMMRALIPHPAGRMPTTSHRPRPQTRPQGQGRRQAGATTTAPTRAPRQPGCPRGSRPAPRNTHPRQPRQGEAVIQETPVYICLHGILRIPETTTTAARVTRTVATTHNNKQAKRSKKEQRASGPSRSKRYRNHKPLRRNDLTARASGPGFPASFPQPSHTI